jgi:hypothetical protein
VQDDDDVDQTNHYWTEHNMAGEDTDVEGDDVDDLDEMLRNVESEFSGKNQNDKLSQIMKDYETILFLGCKKEHDKLHVVMTLLQMKDSNSWYAKGFNELLQFLNDLLKKANVLPQSTYQCKKIVCPLGLKVEKIHTCKMTACFFTTKMPCWRNVVFVEHHDTSKMAKISMNMTWGRIKMLKE